MLSGVRYRCHSQVPFPRSNVMDAFIQRHQQDAIGVVSGFDRVRSPSHRRTCLATILTYTRWTGATTFCRGQAHVGTPNAMHHVWEPLSCGAKRSIWAPNEKSVPDMPEAFCAVARSFAAAQDDKISETHARPPRNLIAPTHRQPMRPRTDDFGWWMEEDQRPESATCSGRAPSHGLHFFPSCMIPRPFDRRRRSHYTAWAAVSRGSPDAKHGPRGEIRH